jgi:methyl-accepting chemotaxis protein
LSFYSEKLLKRRLSNFLLQPIIQTRIGAYCIGLSFLFAGVIAAIVYVHLGKLFGFIIEMTDAPEEVQTIIMSYLSSIQTWVYLTLAAYILFVFAISIWYTHRLVGPMVAFKRHFEALQQGNFTHRTNLRKNDAFHEAANELNKATEMLGVRFDKAGTAKES